MLDPNQHSATTPVPLTNTYDTSGRVTTQSDFAGRTTSFDYTSITGATKITDPAGHVTVDYYSSGLRTKTTAGYGTAAAASTYFTYDSSTEAVASESDPNGHVTSYTYDSSGNVLTVTDPLSRVTTNTYDSLDDLLTTTDGNGVTTTNTYDGNGNLLTTSTPLLSGTGTVLATRTITYTYGDTSHPGDVTGVTGPNGFTTTNTYDADGDVTSTTLPVTPENSSGDQTTYTYDTNTGQKLTMVSPRGNVSGGTPSQYTTTYIYDADGRLTTVKDPLWSSSNPTKHETSTTYDLDGNQASTSDGAGNTTTYTYDADNELTGTSLPTGVTTSQTWSSDGALLTAVDGDGHTTTYTYDSRNDPVTVTDPSGHTTTYSYDLAGNVTLKAAPFATCTGGSPTTGCTAFSYDADKELTAQTYLDGVTHAITAITYDNDGRRTGMTDASGTSTNAYDSLGRMTSTTDGNGVTTGYGYDLDGNVTSISYPGSHTVTRTFDHADRLATVTDWSSNTTTFGYNADSDPSKITYPTATGEVDSNSYNAAGQPTLVSDTRTVGGVQTTLASYTYTNNSNNQIVASVTTGIAEPSQNYGYNPVDEINKSGSASTPTTYGYNHANDIINRGTTSGGTADSQAFNADSELCWSITTAVTSPVCSSPPTGVTAYTYDVNGNRTVTTPATGSATHYAYDEGQHLATYTAPSGAATTYVYDGSGLRQSKTTGGATTHFTWDEAASVPLLLSDGANSYVYGVGDLPVEQISGTGTIIWLHHDQLGSTRLLTDTTGTVTGSANYDPFGAVTATTGTASSPLGFAGQYTDSESGLTYLRARYYDPTTAQFLTRDPMNAVTRSAYGYAGSDPLNETDPTGLCGHWYDLACQVGSAATAVGSGIATGAEWAYNHPVEAGGIALGVVSLATGVGEIAGATVAIGDVTIGSAGLGAISLGTGAVATGLDAKDCFAGGDSAACVGFGLSVPGALSGIADLALPEGLLSEGASTAIDYVGLGTGAAGFGWDLARTFRARCG